MLKKDRLERTIAKMKEKDIPQMLVSDQYALYYLLDKTLFSAKEWVRCTSMLTVPFTSY